MLLFRPGLGRWLALAATAITGLGLAATADPAAAAGSGKVDFVGLGDSYAAGVGAGTSTNACGLTNGAYAKLWAATKPAAVNLATAACSGATSTDVVKKQLSGLTADTDLVSITVGANDLQLVSTLELCLDPKQAAACAAAQGAAQAALTTTLPQSIGGMLKALQNKAPKAKLVLTGYPLPFADVVDCPTFPAPKSLRDSGNALITALNQVLAAQAKAAGAAFLDVTTVFNGHGLCSTTPWFVGLEGQSQGTTLHPTLQGQTHGYLSAFLTGVGSVDDVLQLIAQRDKPKVPPSPSVSRLRFSSGAGWHRRSAGDRHQRLADRGCRDPSARRRRDLLSCRATSAGALYRRLRACRVTE